MDNHYIFPLSSDNYHLLKLPIAQQAREQGSKIVTDQKPNIVQSQLIDFWLLRMIYYLPLFTQMYRKLKSWKIHYEKEAHLVSLNEILSQGDSRISEIANTIPPAFELSKCAGQSTTLSSMDMLNVLNYYYLYPWQWQILPFSKVKYFLGIGVF